MTDLNFDNIPNDAQVFFNDRNDTSNSWSALWGDLTEQEKNYTRIWMHGASLSVRNGVNSIVKEKGELLHDGCYEERAEILWVSL